jgi:glycosyltransferase involved in cell wall biosynthesis
MARQFRTKVALAKELLAKSARVWAHELAANLHSLSGSGCRLEMTQSTLPTVIHVVLTLTPGGTERLVIELCTRLKYVVRPVVCCLDESGVWSNKLTDQGIPVHALERRPGFHPSLAWRVARLARRYRASVLHCHHYSPFVYGVLAGRLARDLSLVFTEHGRLSDAPPSVKRRVMNPILGSLPARLFAVSADLKRHMVAEGFAERRIHVLHNGIDVGLRPSTADRERARHGLGLVPDEFVCGTVGRLDPVKHLTMLVEAHAALRSTGASVHLVVVGGGAEQGALEQLVRRWGTADTVRFIGHRDDVRNLLPALDVYVNCSLHEGISLTILEAMAAALPVIATRVGGNPEVVVDGETGLLVSTRATESLTQALVILMRDAGKRQQMGDAGRRRVERAFDITQMVGEYRREYERLAGITGGTLQNDAVEDALCVDSAERSPFQAH